MQINKIFANLFIIKQLKFLPAGNIFHTIIAWLFSTVGGQIDFLPEVFLALQLSSIHFSIATRISVKDCVELFL
jgi:hypothetical protein